MNLAPQVAKKYIIYREWRTVQREKRTTLKRTMDGIVSIEKNDINLGQCEHECLHALGADDDLRL